jgi:hypothetical protein
MQALLTLGRSSICWTPGRVEVGGSWKAGGSLEAKIYEGFADASSGSGGIWKKWSISEAEVPT